MKKTFLYLSALLAPSLHAAVLQTFAGPTTVDFATNGALGILLVDTATDTNDWIDTYSAGTATIPLYYTFTMTVNNNAGETGTGGFYAGLHLYTGTAERLLVGNEWNNTAWGAFSNGNPTKSNILLNGATTITNGSSATFVVKLDQETNITTVWLNPDFAETEANQAAGITTLIENMGTGDTFDTIRLRAGNTTANVTYSNIEFRNDSPFAPIPEPSTAILGSLGALGLLRRRR